MKRSHRNEGGFILVITGTMLFGLAMGGAGLAIIVNSAENRQTMRKLTSEHASDYESVTDEDIDRLRRDLETNMQIGTLGASLGTPTLPGGTADPSEIVRGALAEGVNAYVTSEVVDHMSDPESTWNREGGAHRQSDGTSPTGGVVPPPPELPEEPVEPKSGEVTMTLRHDHSESDPIHIKRKGESFSPDNRIYPGSSKKIAFTATFGQSITMEAGRGGEVFATTTCTPTADKTSFEVVWADGMGLQTFSFKCF
jgi:hypothetical protein